MEMDAALALVKKQIKTEERHQDYKRTTDLAETYRIYITGEGIEKKLQRFVPREDEALFSQRVALTRSITPAVSSSIRQPFNKVTRNDRIRKGIKLKSGVRREEIVQTMAAQFYGASRKKNRGLEYWLKTRFLELQFIDPNAWVVVEWDSVATEAQVVRPRPFEVSAEEAVNFYAVNDEVRWLFVKQNIKYLTAGPKAGTGATNALVPDNPAYDAEPVKKPGVRYTLYDENVTIVFEQIDKGYLTASGYRLVTGESFETINNIDYIVRTYTPKIGYVPAFRIGYKRDEVTKGRTFVNPWHDALCFFDKSLKTVSELDLTWTLHVFPQKLQYVQKCPGSVVNNVRKMCQSGIIQGTENQQCGTCRGTGYKIHTTAQDAILLPMPDSKDDMIPLDDILIYKSPPTELVKLQNEYTLQLERQAHQAVFNSQVFVRKAGGGMTESTTATEADFNMQSVYDALEPFTEKYSEMWREFMTIFARIAAEPLEGIDATHEFPADYKLKTGDILMGERKTAKESGAPAFLIETIDDDLAGIIYAGDDLALTKYRVKRRYYPFSGKTEEEVAMLLASEFVPEAPKVLYSNFDLIFTELEREIPNFWVMPSVTEQRKKVEEKVKEWQERLKEEKPAPPIFTNFRPGGEGGEGGGDGNPGNDGNNNNDDPDRDENAN